MTQRATDFLINLSVDPRAFANFKENSRVAVNRPKTCMLYMSREKIGRKPTPRWWRGFFPKFGLGTLSARPTTAILAFLPFRHMNR